MDHLANLVQMMSTISYLQNVNENKINVNYITEKEVTDGDLECMFHKCLYQPIFNAFFKLFLDFHLLYFL